MKEPKQCEQTLDFSQILTSSSFSVGGSFVASLETSHPSHQSSPVCARRKLAGFADKTTSVAPTQTQTLYFGTDILGSVRNVTDKYGAVQANYNYDAFGNPYLSNLDNDMNFGYCGKIYDNGTGLYDYGFRDYSPNNARFTTIDPIRDGNNWFAYVVNDPVNYIDPFGLTSTDSGSGKPTNTNPANNNAPNEPSTGSNVQKIKEIMHDNSYNKNAFNPNDLQSKNYTEQLNYIQKVFEEKKQAYNNSMNQKFVKIIRDSVGATYSHTRMPTATEMDCSGILVYTLDKMGFSVPSDLTAADIANGRLPGIILYDEADNSRQGDAGVLNFYYFDENYISHVNYGVGIQGNETKNQVVDASSKNTTWQNGKDGNSGRNANENQNPKAEPGKINKTWAPFTTEEMPDYQAYIDFTKLERKN